MNTSIKKSQVFCKSEKALKIIKRRKDMRDNLKALRPEIDTIDPEATSGDIEKFQNSTLRPILKFQNTILAAVYKNHIGKYSDGFHELPKLKRDEYIQNSIESNKHLRSLLMGMVIGNFTDAEYQDYVIHEKEINRRIRSLIIQRLQDQV